jgi:hypothetical protein
MKIAVNLPEHWRAIGECVGHQRQGDSEAAGRSNAHRSRGGVADHIQGAMAEIAFAYSINAFPSGLGLSIEDDDDVNGVQVRGRREHWHDLYLWRRDDPQCRYVLVTGTWPQYIVHGWIWGHEAKTSEYWVKAYSQGGFPRISSYIIPQSELHDMKELCDVRLLSTA